MEDMTSCKVKYIDAKKRGFELTPNKEYIISKEDETSYKIKNDGGNYVWYDKEYFEIVEEKNKLNIIEAMKMPIGTEFKVIFNDEVIENNTMIIYQSLDNDKNKHMDWKCHPKDTFMKPYDFLINGIFIPIEKPVSFQEVIDKDCILCRVEHEHINSWLSPDSIEKINEYLEFNKLMELLSELPSDELKIVLKYGRWYIKEIVKSC